MRFKRLLALLLAAALALSLLAGCGGGESAASVLLKLLDGRYPNISIEIDPELEADLRQAIHKAEAENAGDAAAVIRAALETALGSNITFRYLGDGQKGDTAFDLVFYAGSDPDKAAQAAYSQWNLVFSNVPDDGQYDTSLAMVETNSGVWMLVKATVEKAGTVDKPDDDPEPEPEPEQPTIVKGTGFSYDVDHNQVTVSGEKGLEELFTDTTNTNSDLVKARDSGFDKITIELEAGKTYTVDTTGPLADTFNGTLQGGNGAKITLTGESRTQGLFNTNNGTVQDVDIKVTGTISSSDNVGAVAGKNYGTIQNCHVAGIGTIESSSTGTYGAGGIAGRNDHIIQGCSASVEVQDGLYTGGVVGWNDGGSVIACFSTSAVSTDLCYAGGVVGINSIGGTVTACYSTGDVEGDSSGGVVGTNSGNVYDCYWSGTVTNLSGDNVGIGDGTDTTIQVTDGNWTDVTAP